MHQNFIIRKWSVWPPLFINGEQASLKQAELLSTIPKMLKRRLSPLARIVFCAANQCIGEDKQFPVVFSSTHGEIAKSFKMMEMIEAGEDISPTAFSLSVHNAIAGLYSIAYKNKIQSTVVAPGEEGIAPAFIEAAGLLQEGAEQVLLVLYDEPLLEFYPVAPYQLTAKHSCAIALRLSKSGVGIPLQFSCLTKSDDDDGEQPLQIPLLLRFLQQQHSELMIRSPRHKWCWKRV